MIIEERLNTNKYNKKDNIYRDPCTVVYNDRLFMGIIICLW